MWDSEAVTFGRSVLDRAAHRRGDADALSKAADARAIVIWRGKPLILGEALALVAMDHAVLAEAERAPLLLGMDGAAPVFAVDISPWEAPDADETAMLQFFDPSHNRHEDAPEGAYFAELRGAMTLLSADDANRAATARAIFAWHDSHGFCARCGERSQIVMAGWQRNCTACRASHFPRTDPVVIVLALHGNSVLVGRSPHWPEGMYSLLAGFVEPGEGIEAASRREVLEESGVRLGQVRYLSSQPWPFPTSLMFGTLGVAENTDITLDPDELEDALWVTREEMMSALAGEREDLRPARPGSIARYLIDAWVSGRVQV